MHVPAFLPLKIFLKKEDTVLRQRLTRQRLTHFMKILEIFQIQKFVEMFCQNTQFSVRIINMMVYSAILTFAGPQIARVRAYLVKISFL